MSRPAPNLSPSAVLIGYKLPVPLKIVLGFGVPVVLLVTWSAIFDTHQYDVAAGMFLLGGGLALLIYTNHKGYRIAWDDERVYMRNWGFWNFLFRRHRYHAMTYDEMASIEGSSAPNPGPPVTRLMPHQSLEIASGHSDVENISIYASGLNERDLGDFLVHLRGKRPDIFPKEVLERMRKVGLIDLPPFAM